MKYPKVLGVSAAIVGGILTAFAGRLILAARVMDFGLSVLLAVGVLLCGTGVLVLASASRRSGSRALLRLDCFLPVLRRTRPGEAERRGWFGKLAVRVLPGSLFSDRQTKQRGLARRGLRRLGISWLSAPVRRLSQTVCFAAFLGLFFAVAWPYDARPPAAVRESLGWRFAEFGQADGRIQFEATSVPSWLQPGSVTYAIEESGGVPLEHARAASDPIAMRLDEVSSDHIRFVPLQELSGETVDRFLLSSADWKLLSRDPTAWPSHYADNLQRKEWLPAELFLVIDPLVSLSTAIASRSWVWSLSSAAVILILCLLVPRGFCGYVCPLGTLIDLFDWSIGRRVTRFRVAEEGWWVHIKYYLLLGTLIAAVCGVLVSGYVAAIPVITRGMLVLGGPLQNGIARGWHLVPPIHLGHIVSLAMFFGVLSLGLLRPRFWCKYVCPSGATFSLGNLFRLTERKVESSCIHCNKCVEICPFDAIKPDFTTRGTDCTLCQTCAGVCPTHAIKFVERGNLVQLKVNNDPPTGETSIGRRGFLSLAGGTAAAIAGGVGITAATRALGTGLNDPERIHPVRPPGSVPEKAFLEMCIRCGECFKACPNDVLQLQGFGQGLEGLWTPAVNADWAGCESSCNACGQVCPTGAIRALPLAEKRVARMGLAIVDESSCLPHVGREACDLCVQECDAAGYHAIEYTQVGTETNEAGEPIAGSGYLAPVVRDGACVGCGLCQTRCYAINVKDKRLLSKSAIIVEAGEGKEDRLMSGSYIELRQQERLRRATDQPAQRVKPGYFVPESAASRPDLGQLPEADRVKIAPSTESQDDPAADADPFGLGGMLE
ncbi:4Fe-4S binding protein [Candidatus Laterigemmans baculatus]|uniref:4Fe-4S binding protein n=1 Tax=Candidatus Laterigemmans baculatus TaxID=2770505 RepID=UPI001F3F07A3|nr:4Fe-4S binding protein [Candidatus Laterigemmans baculatus]